MKIVQNIVSTFGKIKKPCVVLLQVDLEFFHFEKYFRITRIILKNPEAYVPLVDLYILYSMQSILSIYILIYILFSTLNHQTLK